MGADLLEAERAALPELPRARRRRHVETLGLSPYDADLLTQERAVSDYFEAALARLPDEPKLVANWINGELAATLNAAQLAITAARVSPDALAGLLARIKDGTVSGKLAKDVFAAMWAGAGDADTVIAARGLAQVSDDAALVAAIDQVIGANPAQAGQFRAGDEKVFGWLVGQAMKATRGKANPQRLNELLRQRLLYLP